MASARCPWRGLACRGDRGRDWLHRAEDTARCRHPLAVIGRRGRPHGRPFYGTPDLIGLAKAKGWSDRLRLKTNLRAVVAGCSTTLAQHAGRSGCYLSNVELTHRRVVTNIGIIRDPGPDEPWLIAMSEKPGYLTTLDDAARWGIEPMVFDFKSPGFGLEQSQLRRPDRLARLLLVMSLALHVAVSTGLWDAANNPSANEKKPPPISPEISIGADCPGSPVG